MKKSTGQSEVTTLRGERLREVLHMRNKTQMDLVNGGIVSSPQIWRFLNGHGDPTLETFKRIAEYLEVSGDYLIGLSDEPVLKTTGSSGLAAFLEKLIAAMSDSDINEMSVYLKMIVAQRTNKRENS